jgi:hypothetical protein
LTLRLLTLGPLNDIAAHDTALTAVQHFDLSSRGPGSVCGVYLSNIFVNVCKTVFLLLLLWLGSLFVYGNVMRIVNEGYA